MSQYYIKVKLFDAKDLHNTDFVGKLDPFVEVKYLDEKKTTKVYKDAGLNPSFLHSEEFTWNVPFKKVLDTSLSIKVRDSDLLSSDFVGQIVIDLAGLTEGDFKGYLPLFRDAAAGGAGSINVHIQTNIPKKESAPLIFTPARIRNSKMAGLFTGVTVNNATEFNTYEVQMSCVADIFGDHWNANYDAEHAVLFDDSVKGKGLRTILMTEHLALYRDGSRQKHFRVGDRRMEKKWLNSGDGFLELFNGALRYNIRRVYTYVLLDTGMFFSETGIKLSHDTVSKHAVHANASPRVRMAGTFRVCFDPKEKKEILVMDNDSGTYRPTGDHFPMVIQVMNKVFPDLDVVCINCLEPQPEHMKRWIGPRECKAEYEASQSPKGTPRTSVQSGQSGQPSAAGQSRPEASRQSANTGAPRESRQPQKKDESNPLVYPGNWVWVWRSDYIE